MLLRSFLQLVALLLFCFVFLGIVALLSANFGYLGEDARVWVSWGVAQATEHRSAIEKAFAFIGAIGTLTISAFGVYKTWHFAEINLPIRLEELTSQWHDAVIRGRTATVPELAFLTSISLPVQPRRSLLVRLASLIYDFDAVALERCSKRLVQFEKQLGVLDKSQQHCRAEIRTTQLERASILRRCSPKSADEVLRLSKKPLETDPLDWDALELSARHAFSLGYDDEARKYLEQLASVTRSADAVRHARAMRFHAETLISSTPASRKVESERLGAGLAALKAAFVFNPKAKKEELAWGYELLARLHISTRRYRMAREAIAEARRHNGDNEELRKLDQQANPTLN